MEGLNKPQNFVGVPSDFGRIDEFAGNITIGADDDCSPYCGTAVGVQYSIGAADEVVSVADQRILDLTSKR